MALVHLEASPSSKKVPFLTPSMLHLVQHGLCALIFE